MSASLAGAVDGWLSGVVDHLVSAQPLEADDVPGEPAMTIANREPLDFGHLDHRVRWVHKGTEVVVAQAM